MSYPLVYEVNARCWLHELGVRLGRPVTLGSIPDAEISAWERLGFTHLWLMGAWEIGPDARQATLASKDLEHACRDALPDLEPGDIAGSPFAIADYRVARELGGETGLKKFRRQLDRHGLGLLLDFIPNHVGLDHPWARSHPRRFVHAPQAAPETVARSTVEGPLWLAHGRDPYFPPWVDTLQLDYRSADTRAAMTEALAQVAARCDGVRCDMAMLVLNDVFGATWKTFPVAEAPPAREFWSEAIAGIKQRRPEFLFLAEAYWGLEPQLQSLGFDFTYDKRLYDRLVARDHAGAQQHLLNQPPEGLARSAHFLENHDEIRIASLFSPTEHRSAALLTLGLPGFRLIHHGQMEGACLRSPVQLRRQWPEAVQPQIRDLYTRTLAALRRTAIGSGEARLLAPRPAWWDNPTWRNFVVVQWQVLESAFELVVVNQAPHRCQCYVPLAVPDLARSNWRLRDCLSEQGYERVGEDLQNQGLYLDVDPNAAHIFHVEAI